MSSDQGEPVSRAAAQPGRRRVNADVVLELGFQPDRGQAGTAGYSADAAGHVSFGRRVPVLLLIARLRGVRLFERDGTLGAGLFAGLLFGLRILLIFAA